ncbi:MAG: DUF2911 domain-containing protein [Ferruginibacter sp.]
MKKLFAMALLASGLMITTKANAQNDDKSKRPSPPAIVTAKLAGGATITVDYSQPSLKGRTIGMDVEPMDGKVWRTGANEATIFETDKDIMVMGKKLPAGKYGLFTIFDKGEVTVIFNKTWKQWGAFSYKADDDILRVKTKVAEAKPAAEKMVFSVGAGAIGFVWGNKKVEIPVK